MHWSKVIRLYLLLNICLIHAENQCGDRRHFENASDVFSACSEYIVEVRVSLDNKRQLIV